MYKCEALHRTIISDPEINTDIPWYRHICEQQQKKWLWWIKWYKN